MGIQRAVPSCHLSFLEGFVFTFIIDISNEADQAPSLGDAATISSFSCIFPIILLSSLSPAVTPRVYRFEMW